MEYIYVSSTIEEKDFNDYFSRNGRIPGQQVQKYHRLIIEGLKKNGRTVTALSALPITRELSKEKIIKLKSENKEVNYHYITCFNFKVLKNIYVLIVSFLYVFAKCIFQKDSCVICDPLNLSVSLGASTAASLLRKKCCGIVTDLPELMITNINQKNKRFFDSVIKKCTCYIFLTSELNEKLNIQKKPYRIIEGHCDITLEDSRNSFLKEKNKKIICLYAGYLDEKYGVKKLVDSFIKANVHDAELHIYGDGPFSSDLEKIIKVNSNIFYHGVVLNKEVVRSELEADLLVNPRPSNEEYTKYSFPSKNMEYMVSGTPVLTTKLSGMPKEYYEYVYLFDDESVDGMSTTLKTVLSLSKWNLIEKGKRAKSFVLHKKNNVIQSRKIIDLIEN